ncbi:hypothetical protein IJT17_10700, partial [bacterium]|nr:hypothetical protein [bacterium]
YPVFGEMKAVCAELAQKADQPLSGEAFARVMGYVKVSHEHMDLGQKDSAYWELQQHAYDRIINCAATEALQICQKLPTYLGRRESWQESVVSAFITLNSLNDFLVWGTLSGFFGQSNYGLSPRGHEPHTWAVSGLKIMHAVSQCYHEGCELTAEQAQTCYVLAQKFKQMGWLTAAAALAPRLLPPSANGGEGVHSHRLLREERLDGQASESEYSVSDREYYRVMWQRIRWEASIRGLSASYPLSAMLGAVTLVGALGIAFMTITDAVPLDWAAVSAGAVCAVTVAVIAYGAYALGYKALPAKLSNLYAAWAKSPAHGTEPSDLSMEVFAQMLGPEAQKLAVALPKELPVSELSGEPKNEHKEKLKEEPKEEADSVQDKLKEEAQS